MKLAELLRSLSASEMKQFDLFLQSPYHNSDPRLVDFFAVYANIIRASPNLSHILPENLNPLLAGWDLNSRTVNRWNHLLLKLLKDFVVLQKSNMELGHQELLWLEFLRERKVTISRKNELARARIKMDKWSQNEPIAARLFWDFRFAMEELLGSQNEVSRNVGIGLEAVQLALSQFYRFETAKLECAIQNQKEWNPGVLINQSLPTDTIIESYEKLARLLADPFDNALFKDCMDQFAAISSQEPWELIAETFQYLTNVVVRRANHGGSMENEPLLTIYAKFRSLWQTDWPSELQPAWVQKNFVQAACISQNQEIISDFQHWGLSHLPDAIRKYCEAMILFFSPNWKQAEPLLWSSFRLCKDRFLQMDAQIFLLLLQFRSQINYKELEDGYHMFRMAIYRSKMLPPNRLQKYRSFQRFFAKLMRNHPQEGIKAMKSNPHGKNPHSWVIDWLAGKYDN